MRKLLLSFAAIVVLGSGISAQTVDKTVEKIRTYYKDISEKALLAETDDDRGQYGDLVMNEIFINKRNHQWRAVGIYNLDYKFFYSGGNSEEHLYPDQLVKAVVEKKISNRNYTEEYLYSDKGVLMFYFQKTENDDPIPAERRIYFSGPAAVRVVEDAKTRDKLTAKDLSVVRDIQASSAKISELFKRSIAL